MTKPRFNKATLRSGLEDRVAASLMSRGVEPLYETERVQYEVPQKFHWYTPDFKINRKDGTDRKSVV